MRFVHPVAVLFALACVDTSTDKADDALPTGVDLTGTSPTSPDDTSGSRPTLPPLPAARLVDHGGFATADACTDCHTAGTTSTAMRDASGRDISPYQLWQATMMANAGRDPLWRAAVAAEKAAFPTLTGTLDEVCTRCHTPMAHRTAAAEGRAHDATAITRDDDAGQLALDGVSCAVCHQIEPEGLGSEASWTGGFTTAGAATIYGPHADPLTRPMAGRSGFTPTEGDHLLDAALCGTCHTVLTEAHTSDGTGLGEVFHEQAPYLEWRVSAFRTEAPRGPEAASCQACHAPTVDADGTPIRTRIARRPDGGDFPPVGLRAPFGRHIFVGGNTLVPRILRDQRADLNPRASDAAFDAHLERVNAFLEAGAEVAIEQTARDGDTLAADIRVTHDAGHKWPTGFPSRRAWLAVDVRDAAGAVVATVGTWNDAGQILGADGTPLPAEGVGGPMLPHVDTLTSADAPIVWEMVMGDAAGQPVWRLLAAAQPAKDNRLLPRGWDGEAPGAVGIQPVGTGGDPDHVAGGDTVHLRLPVDADGPLTVRVRFVHQVLGARFAAELFAVEAPEIAVFERYASEAGLAPTVVAEAVATVE